MVNNKSTSNQAASADQAAAEAQRARTDANQYSGGDALLDAQVKLSQQQGSEPPVEDPAATNVTGRTHKDEPKKAKNYTTTGAYPVDRKQMEKDYTPSPSLANNPDEPSQQ